MNKMIFLLFGMILLFISCSDGCQKPNYSLIEIDLNSSPSMKRIKLQDIATIEYITVASDSNFIPSTKQLGVSRDMNYMIAGGEGYEVLLLNRQGTPISKINKEGQGPNEYLYASYYTIHDKKVFIYDGWNGKMHVYDFAGTPLYSFERQDVGDIFIYNDSTFICHNFARNKIKQDYMPYYTIISNRTGEILERIDLPYWGNTPISIGFKERDSAGEEFVISTKHLSLIKGLDGNFIFNELSTDTVYQYSTDGSLKPIIVRKPSVKENNHLFLEFCADTKRYIFFHRTIVDRKNPDNLFSSEQWAYDRTEMKIYQAEIIDENFPSRNLNFTPEFMDSPNGYTTLRYRSYHLCEAYKEGKLRGKLEYIASTLNEEDNDVYVLIKFK